MIRLESLQQIVAICKTQPESKLYKISLDSTGQPNQFLITFTTSGYSHIGKNGVMRHLMIAEMINAIKKVTGQEDLNNLALNDINMEVKLFHDKDNKFDQAGAAMFVTVEIKDERFEDYSFYKTPVDVGFVPRFTSDKWAIDYQFNAKLLELIKTGEIDTDNIFLESLQIIDLNDTNFHTAIIGIFVEAHSNILEIGI